MVSFDVSDEDREIIGEIAQRAVALDRKYNGKKAYKMMHHTMNITACHANGNRLRLKELLSADDFNFTHDVFGIDRHINRENGHLGNLFRPRYSVS